MVLLFSTEEFTESFSYFLSYCVCGHSLSTGVIHLLWEFLRVPSWWWLLDWQGASNKTTFSTSLLWQKKQQSVKKNDMKEKMTVVVPLYCSATHLIYMGKRVFHFIQVVNSVQTVFFTTWLHSTMVLLHQGEEKRHHRRRVFVNVTSQKQLLKGRQASPKL